MLSRTPFSLRVRRASCALLFHPAPPPPPSLTLILPPLLTVEFYLSNSNLPFDKFLFGLWATAHHDPAAVIAKTPAPADSPKDSHTAHNSFHLGWLPLDKLASFKRMQPYLEAPPTGLGSVDAIAEVVKGSSLVEVHKFGADGETGAGWYVRRKSPLTKPADAMERSVYAKGFPATEKDGETDEEREKIRAGELDLQKKLEQWARDLDVGKVLSLRMRREDKITEGKNPLKGKGKFKVRRPSPSAVPLSSSAGNVWLTLCLLFCRARCSSSLRRRSPPTSLSSSTPSPPLRARSSRPCPSAPVVLPLSSRAQH